MFIFSSCFISRTWRRRYEHEIFIAIYDRKMNGIENLHAHNFVCTNGNFAGCNARVTLLRNFNRLMDLRQGDK